MSEWGNILDWGIDVVLWFQQFSPLLDLPFKSLTALGDLAFFLVFMPLVYWCLDRGTGVRLLILFLLSAHLNTALKALAHQPRPFQYDPRVKPLVAAGGGGLPSGHTQGAVVVQGYLGARLRNTKMWILAGFLMVAIPLSRLYLGVHFPTDLLGGYILGGVLLVLYLRYGGRVETWLVQKGIRWQMAAAIGVPIILIIFSPQDVPHALDSGGVLLGVLPGIILERRWVRFCSGGRLWSQTIRFAAGIGGLIALWMGLNLLFAAVEPAAISRILRSALVGLWCALGAPWLFVRLRLADCD